jgi:hypothetical protein
MTTVGAHVLESKMNAEALWAFLFLVCGENIEVMDWRITMRVFIAVAVLNTAYVTLLVYSYAS